VKSRDPKQRVDKRAESLPTKGVAGAEQKGVRILLDQNRSLELIPIVTTKVGSYSKSPSYISSDGRIPAMKVPAGPRVPAEDFRFRRLLRHNRQERETDQTQRTKGFPQHLSFS
jgi:hypothetical protein